MTQGARTPGRWRRRLRKLLLGVLVLLVLLVAAREWAFHGPVREPEPLPRSEIIDLHCHVAGLGYGESGCYVSPELRASYKFGPYLRAFSVTREELQERGDGLVVERLAEQVRESRHVKRAVALALDGVVTERGELDLEATEVYVPDDFVARETARYPELLYGASVHPLRQDALERLERAAAAGAVLVKWLPAIQLIDPADERHAPYYRKLVELDLPLLTHAGQERSFTRSRDELSDPARLRLPLSLGVTVIAAHAATTGENEGEDNVDRLVGLLDEFPRLLADVSSLTQVNKLGYLDRVLSEPRFEGRLLYGSDYPLIATLAVSPCYFPLHLRLEQMLRLCAVENPLDQDVELKQALGVPAAIFARTREVLRLP